jgi:hypothetical protein
LKKPWSYFEQDVTAKRSRSTRCPAAGAVLVRPTIDRRPSASKAYQ